MTTVTNAVMNNSLWNNNSSDQLPDINDLFSSTFDFIYNQPYDQDATVIKDDYEETSSDNESHMDISPIDSQMPNLVCGVCGAPAHGYNFDQITCESCKAFFRRNALRNTSNLRCRFSGTCVINSHTRRQCTYCRLKKCFDIKMRKDWIRTDEERELRQLQKLAKEQKRLYNLTNDQQLLFNLPIVVRKKKRLMVKPTIQQLIQPIFTQAFFGFNHNLSAEDQIILNNVFNAHKSVAEKTVNKYIPPPTLIEFLNEESNMHMSLINFYKSIPEFKQLNIEEQIYLLKCNLIKIVHLHCILIQKFQENPMIGVLMSGWLGDDFHYQMSRTRRYFDRFIEHPLILQLALIVLIFSTNLATSFDINESDDVTNKKVVSGIQDYYTAILWRYLNVIYEEKEAIQSMGIITTQILRYQTTMNRMEEHIRREIDYVNPLELSLFRLT